MVRDIPCPECHVRPGYRHSRICKLQTPEEKAEQYDDLYKDYLDHLDRCGKQNSRLAQYVVLWQGKCAVLRHENNQLRKKTKQNQILAHLCKLNGLTITTDKKGCVSVSIQDEPLVTYNFNSPAEAMGFIRGIHEAQNHIVIKDNILQLNETWKKSLDSKLIP